MWSDNSTGQTLHINSTGTYDVTITTSTQCTAVSSFNVISQNVAVSLSSNTSFCQGDSVTLDAGNPGATYQWSNNATSQMITEHSGGAYSVTVTSTSGCTASGTANLNMITVGPATLNLSIHTICSNAGDETLTGGSPAGGTYSGNGVVGNVFQPSTVPPGKYAITYTVTDSGCSASAVDTITVNYCTGIISIGNPMQVDLYPNPNNGNFELIITNGFVNDFSIDVIDVDGRRIFETTHESAQAQYMKKFDLSSLAKGVYFVRVITNNETVVKRVVLQ